MENFEIVIKEESIIEDFIILHVNKGTTEAFGLTFNVVDYYGNYKDGDPHSREVDGMKFVLKQVGEE